ncbi:MAG: SRPBCC family protein, partial [Patulibacter minatonensis]
MLVHEIQCAADAQIAWELISEPRRWKEWAPHLRGAWGLGDPAVRDSALGAARLGGVLPLPARIERVERSAARSHWVWRVGVLRLDHEVRPAPDGGCRIRFTLAAPWPVERALALTYWPVVGLPPRAPRTGRRGGERLG